MARVFLSHSSKDKDFVRRLADDLQDLGHQPWLDEWEIRVGDCIMSKIQEGLTGAHYIVLVLTPEAVASGWVDREWKDAYWREITEKRIVVLPVLLRVCELPSLIRTKKYADFTKRYEIGLAQLAQAIFPPRSEDPKRNLEEIFTPKTQRTYEPEWAVSAEHPRWDSRYDDLDFGSQNAQGAAIIQVSKPHVLVIDAERIWSRENYSSFDFAALDVKVIKRLLGRNASVRYLPSATTETIKNALTKGRYDIIQLYTSVSDRERGVRFSTADGEMSSEVLLALLRLSKTHLLVLASCNSVALAAECYKQLNMIAATRPLRAGIFSEWQEIFYQLLSQGKPLSEAFQIAKITARRHDIDGIPLEMFLKEELIVV